MSSESAQSTVASSSTLWAQASKEWVIPAKPKPGRKPKIDTAASKETHEVDAKGRRVQNRAAQRAFRERKQSQLAELQARVESYERGEIERNVALQQIAKHLKEENERLRNENTSLKEEMSHLQERAAAPTSAPASSGLFDGQDKGDILRSQKRWRDNSAPVPGDEGRIILQPASRKRFRPGTDSPPPSATPAPQYALGGVYAPPSPSMASSPDSNGFSRSPFSPVPFARVSAPSGPSHSQGQPSRSASAGFPISSGDGYKRFDVLGNTPPFDTFDCGLCTENTPCVCRELAMQQGGSTPGLSETIAGFTIDYLAQQSRGSSALKIEDTEARIDNSISNIIEIRSASEDVDMSTGSGKSFTSEATTSQQCPANLMSESPSRPTTNNCVPYQIRLPSPEPIQTSSNASSRSVPLRLNNKRRNTKGKVWQVSSAAPMCSGDPSNCPACKDDDFGKAFCRALGDSASVAAPACASCPNPEACGKAVSSSNASLLPAFAEPNSMPTNDLMSNTSSTSDRGKSASSSASTETSGGLSVCSSPNTTSVTAGVPSGSAGGKAPNSSERIPANEAWARLKSHPNIAFADLSMLADVVARRTKCSGPVSVIHPAPGSITPERDAARSPAVPESREVKDMEKVMEKDSKSVLLTDPHAHFRAQEQRRTQNPQTMHSGEQSVNRAVPTSRGTISSALKLGPGAVGRPVLVPQEELRECGRRHIREVDVVGVREALRILDAQFGKHA